VIFHTAVLAYVSTAGRRAFRASLTGTWIACEAPRVLDLEPGPPSLFALALDGRRVAWADPHGARLSFDPPIGAQLGMNSSASMSISSPSCHVPS
jgi:hypothetical protein